MLRTEAIKRFLIGMTHKDLADLYNYNMECQVNVAQDNGERVDGDYKGRRWHGYSDGQQTWKPIRIPYNAKTEPNYEDIELRFSLDDHAEGIGLTGWDWKNKKSIWVAFDFDAITGHSDKHSKKLTEEELQMISDKLQSIEWVTIRRSTSGKGLHVYVFLDPVTTNNHDEHAALARAILGKMSALADFDFKSKVDTCGGNMWVWHRKMIGTDGLKLVKAGTKLVDIPPNWRDHINVITGKRRKNLPQVIEDDQKIDEFESLTGQRPKVALDTEHKKLIQHLRESKALWWWDQDHHMLVTHTIHLKEAHQALKLKGVFDTLSQGTEKGVDHNCFAFPIRNGAWVVRRYSMGVAEHACWSQDPNGWTRTYLNRAPDIATVSRGYGAIEDTKFGFVFNDAEIAAKAVEALGARVEIPKGPVTFREHKDGRLILEIDATGKEDFPGWLLSKKKDKWTRLIDIRRESAVEPEVANYDDIIRHLVTDTEDAGWVIKTDGSWRSEPKHHVHDALVSMGVEAKEAKSVLGSSVLKPWRLVNRPFHPEYPGDREWNRGAAQFRYQPTINTDALRYKHWIDILHHCGSGLDDAIKNNTWCKANGIIRGGDYLKIWLASLFKEPLQPLPYLFFYGPQNSGKSIFHEAISLLLTKGYKNAGAALRSQGGFNAELEGAIFCYVEELDLRNNKEAYDRIKDWVTSRELLIHPKGKTPYHVVNSTHWVQCANDHKYCPIFSGDTRITVCYTDNLPKDKLIPKDVLIEKLKGEAADFLAEILQLEIPDSGDRLNVPVIVTDDKLVLESQNDNALVAFIKSNCVPCDGALIRVSEMYERFIASLDPNEQGRWSKIRMGRELPPIYPKGRGRDAQHYVSNLRWVEDTDTQPHDYRYSLGKDDYLYEVKNVSVAR